MIKKPDSNKARLKRHCRVRNKISGTPERPRLNVFRSAKHIYAQLIDDVNGVTLASALKQTAATKKARMRLVRKLPSMQLLRASPRSFLTAAATSSTEGSPNWPMGRARAASSSKREVFVWLE